MKHGAEVAALGFGVGLSHQSVPAALVTAACVALVPWAGRRLGWIALCATVMVSAVAYRMEAVVAELLEIEAMSLQEVIDSLGLPPEERDELLELLEAEVTMESASDFLARLVPAEPPPDHTRLLRGFFEDRKSVV